MIAVADRSLDLTQRRTDDVSHEVLTLLERLTTAVESIGRTLEAFKVPQPLAPSTPAVIPARLESKCVQAMKLLHEMGPDNLSAIADAVRVNRRTLYKWPVFMEAVERMRAAEQWVPREPRCASGCVKVAMR